MSFIEGTAMSNRSEEFAHIADAERQLCEEGGPILAAIVRAIEHHKGLRISEVRVTLDGPGLDSSPAAICTIVRAHTVAQSANGQNLNSGGDARKAPGNDSSPSHA